MRARKRALSFASPVEYISAKERPNVDQTHKCSDAYAAEVRAEQMTTSIDDDNVRCITHDDYRAVSFIITILCLHVCCHLVEFTWL